MARNKMKVRAQRKFAQGASAPPAIPESRRSPVVVIEKRPDVDRASTSGVQYLKTQASEALDVLSFVGMHGHTKLKTPEPEKEIEKEARVVLKRLSPTPQIASPRMKLRKRTITHPISEDVEKRKKRPSISETSEDNRPLTYFANNARKEPEPAPPTQMTTRRKKEQTLTTIAKKKKVATNVKSSNKRPQSEIKKNIKKKSTMVIEGDTASMRRITRSCNEGGTQQTSAECVNDRSESRNCEEEFQDPANTVSIDDDDLSSIFHHETVIEVDTLIPRIDNVQTVETISLSDRIMVQSNISAVPSKITCHRLASAETLVLESGRATVTLPEFIRNLFNSPENAPFESDSRDLSVSGMDSEAADGAQGNRDVNINQDELLEKVNMWLNETNQTKETSDRAAFKVPMTPRRREKQPVVPPSPSSLSSISVIHVPISQTEKVLRKRCIAWNFDELSNVFTNVQLIAKFCTECTRCLMMFKPEDTRGTFGSTNFDPPASSTADVYEFESDRSHVIRPYRAARTDDYQNKTRNQIVAELNKLMTAKGKKLLRATSIIKDCDNGVALSPKNQLVLAQVVSILIESKTAQELISSKVTTALTKLQTECANITHFDPIKSDPENENPIPNIVEGPDSLLRFAIEGSSSVVFSPTSVDFEQSPALYYSKILRDFKNISLCLLKKPNDFVPICNINDTQGTFKLTNQYIYKMLHRWGPVTSQLACIRVAQKATVLRSPLLNGLEVDLVKLYNIIKEESKNPSYKNEMDRWKAVSARMGYNGKNGNKMESMYYKYLLAYQTSSKEELSAMNADVNKCWAKHEKKAESRARNALWRQEHMLTGQPIEHEVPSLVERAIAEADECVTPGRSCNLATFKKIAAEVVTRYFPNTAEPSPKEVEKEFWNIVTSANAHVCVHTASVDTADNGYGFEADPKEPCGDHPWNLKRLSVSPLNLLKHLGPSPGASSTTLHYGMLFSVSCWHMDPTMVPWIEYLHHGPPKIWYSISEDQGEAFRAAVEILCPSAVQHKGIWLPSDIIMIPPAVLREHGVKVTQHLQMPGEYVVVFPNTYCASINTGFTISEGIYFAVHSWIENIQSIFVNLRRFCEPSLFSMEKLLIAMAIDPQTPHEILQQVYTVLKPLLRSEIGYRQQMANYNIGLMSPEVYLTHNKRATLSSWQIQKTGECAYCRCHIHVSRMIGLTEGQTGLCSKHGLELFDREKARKQDLSKVYCILLVSTPDIKDILKELKKKLGAKLSKL